MIGIYGKRGIEIYQSESLYPYCKEVLFNHLPILRGLEVEELGLRDHQIIALAY